MVIIDIPHISKSYGKTFKLEIFDLKINKGEKVVLSGSNGSGKTTLIRLILDLEKADSGEIYLFNETNKNNEKWKSKTGVYLDNSFLIDFLNGKEYIKLLNPQCSYEELEVLKYKLKFNSLDLDQKIEALSSGNKKKLGLLSIFSNPLNDLFIIDEISNFLDNDSKCSIINYISNLHDKTILIIDHDIHSLKHFASRYITLNNGKIQ